jgi:hypothetical protein
MTKARTPASRWLADTTRWSVPSTLAVLLFLLPLTGVAGLQIFRSVDLTGYLAWMRENGPVEWAQVIGFSVAAAASAVSAWRLRQAGATAPALLYAIGSLVLFFVVGEELAWGQLLVGFGTPAEIARWNTKGEFSVHNLSSIERWFNLAKLLVGLYGAFGFLVFSAGASTRLPPWFDFIVVPRFLSSAFLLVAVLRGMRAMRWIQRGVGEYEELLIAYGAAVFTILVSRRIRRESSSR